MKMHGNFKQCWLNRQIRVICGALVVGSCGLVPVALVVPAVAQSDVTSYDIDKNYRSARAMFDRGDLDGAEKVFKEILNIQPSHTASRSYLHKIKEKRADVPQVTLEHQLKTLIIKEVNMVDYTFSDAVKFLRVKVPELLAESGKKGVNANFVVFNSGGQADKTITTELVMKNVPVSVFIRYLCDIGGFSATYRGDIVEFRPTSE